MLARVPWTPKPETKPKPRRLNRDRRRHLVETIAAIMKRGLENGAPTKFTYEATCRHGIRSKLCLQGWGWHEADAVALDIVGAALRQLGAVRPPWAEGQPEWAQNGSGALIERTRCVRCHTPLPEGHTKFCGQTCNATWHMALDRVKEAREDRVYDLIVSPGGRRKYVD